MPQLPQSLPRILKEPTGWVVIVLVAGFFYVQWPTHGRAPETPQYVTQSPVPGFTVQWEEQPTLESAENPTAWGLNRKGMSFLVQTGELTRPFNELVAEVAQQDKAEVGGAEQEPLVIGDSAARYAWFDAESRVQQHRWYKIDDQWVKISVLYKPSMESRVERAAYFLSHATPG